jgi:hypothetical protein
VIRSFLLNSETASLYASINSMDKRGNRIRRAQETGTANFQYSLGTEMGPILPRLDFGAPKTNSVRGFSWNVVGSRSYEGSWLEMLLNGGAGADQLISRHRSRLAGGKCCVRKRIRKFSVKYM